MQAPLRFGVIGCGLLARGQHIPNIARSKKADLYVCCDLSDAALAECRDVHGTKRTTKDWKQVIADDNVEAICLATTQKLRLPVIAAAMEAGKPVYVEKPLAETLEEMYEIQKVVHEAGIPLCVGHNRRNAPAMIDAHEIFRSHMTYPKSCPWRFDREGANRPKWPDDGVAAMSVRINDDWWSWKAHGMEEDPSGGGAMLFEMTHFTDLCNWFLAGEPKEVASLRTGKLNHGVVITYAGGELATIFMGGNGTFGYPKELYEMFGNGGAVVVDHMVELRTAGIEGAPARKTYPMLNDRHPEVGTEGGLYGWLKKVEANHADAIAAGDKLLGFSTQPDKGHAAAMDRFVDEIRGEGPVVCDVDSAVAATRVAFAAIRAARERRVVSLEEV